MRTLGLLVAFLAAVPAAAQKGKASPKTAVDEDPPSIVHTPLRTAPEGKDLTFNVDIIDASGVFEPVVSWRRIGEDKWHLTALTPTQGNSFRAMLFGIDVTANIEYFVEAYDQQGNGPTRMGSPSAPLVITVEKKALPPPPPPPPPPPVASGPGFVELYAPHATIGAGGVMVLVGALMWFGASSTVSDLETRYPRGLALQQTDLAEAQSAVSQSRIGSILMIAGVLAGGGGTAWLFMRPPPAGAGGMLSVGGEF